MEPKSKLVAQIEHIRNLLETKQNLFKVKSEGKSSFGFQKVKKVLRERCQNFQLIQESKTKMFKEEDSAFDLEEEIIITLKNDSQRYNFIETDDETYLSHSISDSPIIPTFYQKTSLLGLLSPIESIF